MGGRRIKQPAFRAFITDGVEKMHEPSNMGRIRVFQAFADAFRRVLGGPVMGCKIVNLAGAALRDQLPDRVRRKNRKGFRRPAARHTGAIDADYLDRVVMQRLAEIKPVLPRTADNQSRPVFT